MSSPLPPFVNVNMNVNRNNKWDNYALFYCLLICVFLLEKRLTVLDGELRHHRACPEHIAVHCDVVAEDLGENPLGLQLPIQHLMTRPHPPLHCLILHQIGIIPWALYLVGVAAVALVDLDPLARLKEGP
jgi:hypothetical protein